MIFANSLGLNQARQNVRPDLEPNRLTVMVFLKESFGEKNKQTTKKNAKLPSRQRVKLSNLNFNACHRILAKKYVNLKELRVGASMGGGTSPSG